MARIFIAIRFDDEFKKVLVAIQDSLMERGVQGNYCPYGNLHMTLAFVGNEQKLKQKNPLENVAAIEDAYRMVLDKVPLDQEILDFMTNESQLGFLLFLCGGAKVWFENNI